MEDTLRRLSILVCALTCLTPCYADIYQPPLCPPTGHTVYPNDNCQLYYACDDGMLKVLTCPIGERFDRLLLHCRPALLVDCAFIPIIPPPFKNDTTPVPPSTNTSVITTTKTTTPTSTTPRITTHPTTTTPKPPVVCPPVGTHIFPTGDCVTYFNCTNGNYVIENCPPGDLVDPETAQCKPFFDVTCYPVTTKAPETPTKITPGPPAICPPTGSHIIPTGDCVTFYNCTNGKYVIGNCPPGDLLDPATAQCKPFFDVTCYPVTKTPVTTPTPTTPPPVICPPTGSQSFPTGDCFTYYQCTNGKYTVQNCPPGNLFDPATNQCLPFYDVTCYPKKSWRHAESETETTVTSSTVTTPIITTTGRPTPTSPLTTTPSTTPSTTTSTTTSSTTTSTTTRPPTTSRSAATTLPSSTTSTTLPPTPPSTTYSCPPTGQAQYPTGNCVSYYNCNNGILTTQSCSLGQNYDPSLKTCVPFFLSSCTPALATMPPPAADEVHSENQPPQSICPPSGVLLVPAMDCQSYYHCSDGQLTTRNCPGGRHFDPFLLSCLPISFVQCP